MNATSQGRRIVRLVSPRQMRAISGPRNRMLSAIAALSGSTGALTGAGLPRGELPLALLTFNIGVEIGQIAFVLLVVLLERSFRQLEIQWPVWTTRIPGYLIGSAGAFWTIQRTAILLGVVQ